MSGLHMGQLASSCIQHLDYLETRHGKLSLLAWLTTVELILEASHLNVRLCDTEGSNA